MDRVMAVLTALLVVASTYVALVFFSFSWSWLALAAWTVGLGLWVWIGLIKVEVGFRGQLLFIGQRMAATVGEGWRWAPFPFSLKLADCRQQIMELDKIKAMTIDNVEVTISATVTYYVVDLNTFFGVEVSGLKRGIDDARDHLIRTRVRTMVFDNVLGSHRELGDDLLLALSLESEEWGVRVIRVLIPEITPADTKMSEDMALRSREQFQREGQIVELRHFAEQVAELMAPPPAGPGLTREQAVEQVQLALGRASKAIDAKTIALDPATAAIVAAILAGRGRP